MSSAKGLVSKFIDLQMGIRVSVIDATTVVQDMRKIQSTTPLPTMFVGRAMVAAALMASHLKENEMVSLYFRGDGALQMVFAEATYEGHVRGYTPNPELDATPIAGSYALGKAIGKGHLTVVRTHATRGSPYRGTVDLQTGEVGDDVAYYLMQSQQIRSIVSVGVKLGAYGQVMGAGGIIIELMPGADEKTEDLLAQQIIGIGSISESFESARSHHDIVTEYVGSAHNLQLLEAEHRLAYVCRCSQDRLVRSLELLPVKDMDELLQKESVNAMCDFCGRSYVMTKEEVQSLRDKKYKNSLN